MHIELHGDSQLSQIDEKVGDTHASAAPPDPREGVYIAANFEIHIVVEKLRNDPGRSVI